jgi:carbon dioxide concentrating mechanism protein CcmM
MPQSSQSELQAHHSSQPRNRHDDSQSKLQERHASTATATATLDSEAVQQIRRLIAQGYRIGIEHVDKRRFRTGSWQSCGSLQTHNESEAIATLETCLTSHPGEYVRLFGIDSSKRRVMETIVQRP